MNDALNITNLTAGYLGRPVIFDLCFTVPQGVICGVIGPNGSGKSTLLKSIMGLIHPMQGTIQVLGHSIDQVRSKIAYVPQRESVDWNFPVSVYDVALMGRYAPDNIFKRLKNSDKEATLKALEKVHLLEYKDKPIGQLSGGQQQRVFIARALAREAELYIMDEPFAGVDSVTESAILKLLKEMKQEKKTVVIVHHDLQTAFDYFDYFVMINRKLIFSGQKKEALQPQYLFETYGGGLPALDRIRTAGNAREEIAKS
ncbi:metal ABC transporter ATP-binding protein [Schleiferia thermophila]|uniref:Manganese/zinc/iron transport system ATP-binding protein n=1 Tax=Schleiferia thermophila TaxID=884107 RepID=A0A369A408_9FLAO|nr:metal ABC transporter ATP-binding protein [Schleiferia thermophila]RCX03903.1 manganese/zinc/iron transport system ATP- binding protein [Schleiferia thermophila]GCD80135.1 manganese ABC transporter ATP-binding protein [Schleiferia thermophila]